MLYLFLNLISSTKHVDGLRLILWKKDIVIFFCHKGSNRFEKQKLTDCSSVGKLMVKVRSEVSASGQLRWTEAYFWSELV